MAPQSQQANIRSFFGAKKETSEQKENDKNVVSATAPKAESPIKRKLAKDAIESKKRRVIDDDSSDDEEMQFEGNNQPKTDKPPIKETTKSPVKQEALPKDVTPTPPAAKKPSPSINAFFSGKPKTTSTEKATQPMDQEKESSKLTKEVSTSSSVKDTAASTTLPIRTVGESSDLVQALKGKVKADAALLSEIASSWDPTTVKDMPYVILCRAFAAIEAITSRLQIQEILTTLFRQILLLSPQDMYPVLYLASNSVAPSYECVELGIGDAILIKAISEATGVSGKGIKDKYETEGDLGIVTQNCKGKQKTLGGFFKKTTSTPAAALSAREVLTVFREIAKTKGNQSQKWKVDRIKKLLVKATDPLETRYIIRGLQGKLRIGLARSTVLISLAHALALTVPPEVQDSKETLSDEAPDEAKQFVDKSALPEKRLEAAVAIMKKAYSEVPSYDAILDAGMKVPLQHLYKACSLTPGIPVEPMLAKPTKSIQEVLKRLNGVKFTCEYKYDGERAQVHLLPDGKTKVFSRNLLDTSEKYPEVPLFVKEACQNVDSFVLDAEVVAFNNKTGQLVPFQILSTRKKTEESAETAKVQVIVQAFDLMFLNGKSLLNKTLAERRQLLHEHFHEVPGKFRFAESMDHEENGDTTVIEDFLDAAVKGQCEGLMVKTLEVNAIYEPSRRSLNWLKLKKDYLEGLGDSVDLVPLGAYHGRGKRTGVYGAYLLACYDADTEEFQSVCKIGTGFSDEDLKTLAESLNKHVIPTKSSQYNVSDQLECDVWFDAVQVWEVKAADLSKSSAHRGAEGKTGEEGRGIGLRFPRFERLRDDKRPEEATTSDQILEMYYAQDTIVGGDDGDMDDDGI